jgi:hypothetical protein
MPEYVAPAVYVEARDICRLLDTLIDILKKARHVRPILVVVDSISAVIHPLTINHPDYAMEKMHTLAHIARQLNQENVTLLVVSWHLGGYNGKYLNPDLVLNTEKYHNVFRLVVKYCEDMLTPVEELIPIGEWLGLHLHDLFRRRKTDEKTSATGRPTPLSCILVRASDDVKVVLDRSLKLQNETS